MKKGPIPPEIEKIYTYINENFKQLPFSWRWIEQAGFRKDQIKSAKKHLLNKQIIHGYPVLVEIKRKPVSQAEETIYVDNKKIIVLTR